MTANSSLFQSLHSLFSLQSPSRRRRASRKTETSVHGQLEVCEPRMLLTVPGLNSMPAGAGFEIYLDFDGDNFTPVRLNSGGGFGSIRSVAPQEFTLDNNVGIANAPVQSALENQWIEEIYHRVAEDFRPFTVNVTTDQPSGLVPFVHVYIGRTSAVPLRGGGTYTFTPEVFAVKGEVDLNRGMPVLVFPDDLQGVAKSPQTIARLVSKGVGIQMGLDSYDSSNAVGTADVGPIMGNPISGVLRDTWGSGFARGVLQDDITILTGAGGQYQNSGVRLTGDDYGGITTGSPLTNVPAPLATGAIQDLGVPGSVDSDYFQISVDLSQVNTLTAVQLVTQGLNLPAMTLQNGTVASNATPGSNLDIVTNLYDSSFNLVASDSDPTSIFGNITYVVPKSEWGSTTTYYLEVRTTSERGSLGQYNVSGYFESVQAPVLTQPTGTVSTQYPTFAWTSVSTPISYELELRNQQTGAVVLTTTTSPGTTQFTPTRPLPQGTYIAVVRSNFGPNDKVPSQPVVFSIDVPLPAVPVITRPVGDITDSFPIFVWSGDAVTPNYSIWVDDVTNPNAKTRVIYRTDYAGTSYVHFNPLKDGTYRAWVRAFNVVGEFSSWSKPVTFTIDAPIPVAPTVTGPVALSTNETPRITWTAVDGAARYDLWVNNLTTGVAQYIRNTNISYKTPYFDTPALPQGSYKVWVRAANGNNELSNWSTPYVFTVDIERPGIPKIIGPGGEIINQTITTANPTFTWTAAVRAVKYDLWVNNVTTGQTQIIRQQNITGLSYVALNRLPQGNYRAWVRGINSANEVGDWSTVSIFNLDEPTPSLPTIIEPKSNPAGSVENPNPTFVWTSAFDAPFYEFRLDDTTLNKIGVISVSNIQTKSYTIPNDKRLEEHVYLAYVRGVNYAGEMSDWSPAYRVRIDVPNPTTPTIIAPTLTSKDTTPTFEWKLDSGSVRYEILVRDLERNETIVLQVNSFLVNTTDPTNQFAYYTLPDSQAFKTSTYRFWIRGFNALGTSSSWSAAQTFVISASLDLKALKIVEPARLQSAEEFYADATFDTDPEVESQDVMEMNVAVVDPQAMDLASVMIPEHVDAMPAAMIENVMESLADPASATSAMLSSMTFTDDYSQSQSNKTTTAAVSILALGMIPMRRKRREE